MDESFLPKEAKRRRLRTLLADRERGFRRRLAAYCGVDPRTLINWVRDDGSWPAAATEQRLWEFFQRLETPTLTKSDPMITLRDVERLLRADPTRPVGTLTMADIQEKLRHTVRFLMGMVGPSELDNGEPTSSKKPP